MKKMALALALLAGSAGAQEVEFLKIKVGAPPPPQCPVEEMAPGVRMYRNAPDGSSCVKPFAAIEPAPLPTGPKYTLDAMVPSAPRGTQRVTLTVLDGLVESVNVTTNGYSSQASILKALEDRFGAPESSSANPVQNAMGASFEALQASWAVGHVGIRFNGILGRIDRGSVRVSTPKGDEDLVSTYSDRGSF